MKGFLIRVLLGALASCVFLIIFMFVGSLVFPEDNSTWVLRFAQFGFGVLITFGSAIIIAVLWLVGDDVMGVIDGGRKNIKRWYKK